MSYKYSNTTYDNNSDNMRDRLDVDPAEDITAYIYIYIGENTHVMIGLKCSKTWLCNKICTDMILATFDSICNLLIS